MSALVKYKNQTEYSFCRWINSPTTLAHPNDKDRFLIFVKTVCIFGSKRWQSRCFLESKILERVPDIDNDELEDILDLYMTLIDFYKVKGMPRSWVIEERAEAKDDYYVERGIKNGKFYEIEKPIKEYLELSRKPYPKK